MTDRDTYRVFAVKYAERDARRAEHFLGGDPHDAPMPMDYFVWAVVGAERTWVVDTGFGPSDAAAPPGPLITQSEAPSASRMCRRSASSRVSSFRAAGGAG